MKKINANESLYVLGLLFMTCPVAAISDPGNNKPAGHASRVAVPPVMEMDISSWLEQSREEAFTDFREQWQAEARRVVNNLGNYDMQSDLNSSLAQGFAEEAKENLAIILGGQDEPLNVQPEVESLAAN